MYSFLSEAPLFVNVWLQDIMLHLCGLGVLGRTDDILQTVRKLLQNLPGRPATPKALCIGGLRHQTLAHSFNHIARHYAARLPGRNIILPVI